MKEEFFATCLGYHMKRTAEHFKKLRFAKPYFHLDLNAGSGYNQDVKTVGTPILFMRQATGQYSSMNIHAVFLENNRNTFQKLNARMCAGFGQELNPCLFGGDRTFSLHRVDNKQYLKTYVAEVERLDRPEYAQGSIIYDPNGPGEKQGGSVSLIDLHEVFRALPKFIVLIFFPYAQAARVNGFARKYPEKHFPERYAEDFLPLREHWLVRQAGRNLFMCGTPWKFPEGPDYCPMYNINSPKGREVMDKSRRPHGKPPIS